MHFDAWYKKMLDAMAAGSDIEDQAAFRAAFKKLPELTSEADNGKPSMHAVHTDEASRRGSSS